MMTRYPAVLGFLAFVVILPYSLSAETFVDRLPLAGQDVSFPEECLKPPTDPNDSSTGEQGGFIYTGGDMVTITTIKYNADNTSGIVTILSFTDRAVAIGYGSAEGISAEGAPYRIVEGSASMSIQLKNGYGENDQFVYTSFIGKGSAPDISGYSIVHFRVWADPSAENGIRVLTDITKNHVSCPVPSH